LRPINLDVNVLQFFKTTVNMVNIVISGGTGLVGAGLVKKLVERNYSVTILTRNQNSTAAQKNVQYSYWNIDEGYIDESVIKNAHAIIHLAGAGVMDQAWSAAYKQEIEQSRVKSANLLVHALKNNIHNCKVLVTASAIGWYGEDKDGGNPFTEGAAADAGYLGAVCKKWEQASFNAEALGIRVVALRLGIVLSKKGGAYVEFRKTIPFGLASVIGNGKQMVSWVHVDDVVNMFLFAIEQNISGQYNCVAPQPVSNKELTNAIAKHLKGSWYITLPVPSFMLKLLLGERAIEILKSTNVSSTKIISAGFNFLYKDVTAAIAALEK
jgi:uncharacterized protein